MKRTAPILFLALAGTLLLTVKGSSQNNLDATYIGDNYYNGIVKILLYDSLAEKKQPGTGYIGRGSGFLVTDDGLIFTNRHVVEYSVYGYMQYIYNDPNTMQELTDFGPFSETTVREPTTKAVLKSGYTAPIVQVYYGKGAGQYTLYYAKVVALDAGSFDGAILKIVSDLNGNPVKDKFRPIPIGNSDSTRQGEDLCIYGYPAQFDADFNLTLQDMSTLTFGKHSGFDFVFNKDYGYIKTDASINSGNSGGPVFNKYNKVIGIATATGNKTNIGLVGGINGMYTIAKYNEELLEQLKKAGLHPPPSKAETGSAIINGTRRPILSEKVLNRLATGKKMERKFQGGTFYIKLMPFAPSVNATFQLSTTQEIPIDPSYAQQSGSQNLAKMALGLSTGYLFPLWRMSPHAKLSFDFTFICARFVDTYWHGTKLNDTIPTSDIHNRDPITIGSFSMNFGPSFSFLVFKRLTAEFHGQVAPTYFAPPSNEIDFSLQPPSGNGTTTLNMDKKMLVNVNFGASIRYNLVSLGVEFFSAKKNASYTVQTSTGKTIDYPDGKMNMSMLLVCLGINFGSKGW